MGILDFIAGWLSRIGSEVFTVKMAVEQNVSFSNDALHILGGVLLQLVIAFALRTSLASFTPWLIVLALELANEWNDLYMEIWPNRAEQLGESAKDIILTMLLPTVLLIVARTRPKLLARRS
jgi:Na+(H+)/acetate symporter ActP